MPIYVPPVSPDEIYHSAKGSTWKKHKYLKKIRNTYVYAKKSNQYSKRANQYYKKRDKAQRSAGDAITDARAALGSVSRFNPKPSREWYKHRLAVAERYGDKASVYHDAAWDNEDKARRYTSMAKKELSSIPKEIVSDGKNLFNKLKSKLTKKR